MSRVLKGGANPDPREVLCQTNPRATILVNGKWLMRINTETAWSIKPLSEGCPAIGGNFVGWPRTGYTWEVVDHG